MLSEYQDLIPDLKASNAHFAAIFEKHNELDKQINDIEEGRGHMEDLELEKLKKEKLRLKDEAHALIVAYKKEKNL